MAMSERRRPLVIAHRGSSAERPEHTLAAYRLAIEQGVDGVECDVRLTVDGELVCIHDRTVNRTSNGRGVVSTMTLAELERLDFGSWHPPGEPEGVLTFAALLRLLGEAPRPIRLLIETKHPNRYRGRVELRVAETLAEVAASTGADVAPVVVMSFADTAVHRLTGLLPQVPTVLLMETAYGPRRSGALPRGVSISGPSLSMLLRDPGFVERSHARGNQVYVWTVDESADLRYVIDLGVDAVITDRPAEALALIGASD
jgi:glycerophosphoryl diester phosphodiesterase